MDAQMQTLDYAGRKKDYDEVQEILAEQQPMIFTVTPVIYSPPSVRTSATCAQRR